MEELCEVVLNTSKNNEEGNGPSTSKKAKYNINQILLDQKVFDLDDVESDESDYSLDSDSNSDDQCFNNQSNFPLDNSDTNWTDNSSSLEQFPFLKKEELLVVSPGENPMDYFRMLLTDEFLQNIIYQTNIYANKICNFEENKTKASISTWKDLTLPELWTFLALLLHAGNIKIKKLRDYWKKNKLFNLACFSENMARNRFLLILRFMRFTNIESTEQNSVNKFYEIEPVINYFNDRMSQIFYPGRELNFDLSAVIRRNKFVFQLYKIWEKCFFKLYMLTNPDGFVIQFAIYSDNNMNKCSDDIILHLLKDKLNAGHSLFLDSFHVSYNLLLNLLREKTYCTSAGKFRINYGKCPISIRKYNLRRGESIGKYREGVLIGKWKEKANIFYISTQYENTMIETQNKRNEPNGKPLPLSMYQKYMRGRHKQEKNRIYYPLEKTVMNWPMKILIHTLQVIMFNAHYLYNKYSGNTMNMSDFRISIISAILGYDCSNTISGYDLFSSSIRTEAKLQHVLTQREGKNAAGKVLRKRCKLCSQTGIRKDSTYHCKQCPGSPGYCLDCSIIIHK